MAPATSTSSVRRAGRYRVPVPHTAEDQVGYVAHLRTTPIKGFTMRESSSAFITVDEGVAGDRAFFLLDEAGTLLSTSRTACFLRLWASFDPDSDVLAIGHGAETLMEDRVLDGAAVRAHFFADRYATGRIVLGRWSGFLSQIAGRPVRLARAVGPLGGFDVHPLSMVSEGSVLALTDDAGGVPLDGRRFRMTVTVAGVPAFAEDDWLGEALCVGDAVVRVTSQVRRCAAVQKDPDGGRTRGNALRRIKEVRGTTTTGSGRGLHLGVYADVERSGRVRVGDGVRLAG